MCRCKKNAFRETEKTLSVPYTVIKEIKFCKEDEPIEQMEIREMKLGSKTLKKKKYGET